MRLISFIGISMSFFFAVSPVHSNSIPEEIPTEASDTFQQGCNAFYHENYQKAQQIFENLVEQHPQNAEMVCWLAKSKAFQLEEKAKRGASRLTLLPAGREIYNLYNKAVELNPENKRARLGYAIILRDIPARILGGDLEKAETMLKNLLEEDPTYYLAYHHLGNLYIHKKDQVDKGITLLKRAVDVAENHDINRYDKQYLSRTYHAIGKAYLHKKDQPEDAIPFFEKTLEMEPDFISGMIDLVDAYQRTNQKQEANEILGEVASLAKQREYKYFYDDIRDAAKKLGLENEINL